MEVDDILKYCFDYLDETVLVESWSEWRIFYNSYNRLKRGLYIFNN